MTSKSLGLFSHPLFCGAEGTLLQIENLQNEPSTSGLNGKSRLICNFLQVFEAQSKRSSPWAELRSLLCAAGRRICRLRCRASSKTAGISCVSRPFCFLNDVLSAKIPFPRPFRIPHPSDCPRGTGKGLPETPSVAYTYKLSKEMKSLGRMPKCLRKHLAKYDGVLKPTI